VTQWHRLAEGGQIVLTPDTYPLHCHKPRLRINPAADKLHLGHENPLGNRIDARYS